MMFMVWGLGFWVLRVCMILCVCVREGSLMPGVLGVQGQTVAGSGWCEMHA